MGYRVLKDLVINQMEFPVYWDFLSVTEFASGWVPTRPRDRQAQTRWVVLQPEKRRYDVHYHSLARLSRGIGVLARQGPRRFLQKRCAKRSGQRFMRTTIVCYLETLCVKYAKVSPHRKLNLTMRLVGWALAQLDRGEFSKHRSNILDFYRTTQTWADGLPVRQAPEWAVTLVKQPPSAQIRLGFAPAQKAGPRSNALCALIPQRFDGHTELVGSVCLHHTLTARLRYGPRESCLDWSGLSSQCLRRERPRFAQGWTPTKPSQT